MYSQLCVPSHRDVLCIKMIRLDNLDSCTHGDLLAIDVEEIICPVTVRVEIVGKEFLTKEMLLTI